MDALDRRIINTLQKGFPICDRPYAAAAQALETSEAELLARLEKLLDEGLLTRFGPMFNAERIGGALSLCAMQVPESVFERVAEQVNAFPEVAHNYQRNHKFNMWFVIATESREELEDVIENIESATGFWVYNMPKVEEFYVGLHLEI